MSKIGLAACVIFYGITAAYGVIAGGHSERIRQSVANATNTMAISAGFEMQTVQVKGTRNMKQAQIAEALGAYKGLSVFAFDTSGARRRLEASGWVERAEIMRILPSTVVVELSERAPYALWREGGKLAAIDADGKALGLVKRSEFPALPVLSGPGAAAPAKEIVSALKGYPELLALMSDIERIVGRRWDLVLESGLRVKLPATDYDEALAGLGRIAAQNPGAFYEISEMDFRAPTQFTLRLKDESEQARQAFLSRLSQTAESSGSVF